MAVLEDGNRNGRLERQPHDQQNQSPGHQPGGPCEHVTVARGVGPDNLDGRGRYS